VVKCGDAWAGRKGRWGPGAEVAGGGSGFCQIDGRGGNSGVRILNPWEGGGQIIFGEKEVTCTVTFEFTRGSDRNFFLKQ
jgi:hypothetical protein